MATVKEIYDILDKFYPFNLAMDFDNVGLLIGDFNTPVKKALVALDVTDDVLAAAVANRANLIITHHPVIFRPIKRIFSSDIAHKIINNDINVICAHTNLDMAKNGVNDTLAAALSLSGLTPLAHRDENVAIPSLGVIGNLQNPMSSKEFASFIKNSLSCNGLRFTNISAQKNILKVAICSGSGGNPIETAAALRVDAFVTGEIKHHEILFAIKNNITVVDVGHFQSENIIVKKVADLLKSNFPNLDVSFSQNRLDKIEYIV